MMAVEGMVNAEGFTTDIICGQQRWVPSIAKALSVPEVSSKFIKTWYTENFANELYIKYLARMRINDLANAH